MKNHRNKTEKSYPPEVVLNVQKYPLDFIFSDRFFKHVF